MHTERLNCDALVFHASANGSRTPEDTREPLPAASSAVRETGDPGPAPGDGSGRRFSSEDVAEEAVLEPAKRPAASTIHGAAHGWRQRRRLRSRWFCR